MSVHNLGTCKSNVAARWRLLTHFAVKHVFESEGAPPCNRILFESPEIV